VAVLQHNGIPQYKRYRKQVHKSLCSVAVAASFAVFECRPSVAAAGACLQRRTREREAIAAASTVSEESHNKQYNTDLRS
jgi:hypothetical protein